ncbi:MarR family winged helix-turn-helix transcriptional regulator [Candidatus Protochlamydia phocaeensis]|uniref:MarR family winged helix-turn-helix transcriptional regulator n=1 Tax=Candidatus Protochlamydia phocaeensis TaxID=1414722 RepID=UPI0008384144|nr:MarR family transcriptional regulator [Candidatus Protochlamydia phocaeensis]
MASFDFDQTSAFQRAEDSPGFLLWRASTRWRKAIENALKPLGLTHPQFVILASIGWFTRGDAKVSQARIGQHAGLDANTTSQILRSLEDKKLIERVRSKDERSKHSTLTTEGIRCLSEALPAVEKADAHFFCTINLQKTKALEILKALAALEDE